ncbi:S-adenosyl-L-methionine-dependent methyltransferase [Aureobasidium pullulans]|nr:S-adenosyl-L-methionine-dependent methyltransferase [Aureobasidium pullulans]THX86583.1 S-adenosyl-L-methionine-dependent methyltransferase [Aureobasidium pullulans]TIA11864.1 S-adenosyl-L-methionine-dependent methyltransferase [Aureobasidium pullulans]
MAVVKLPAVRADDAFGEQVRSHYTVEENSNKPVDLVKLEEEREKRKGKYSQIAHDYYELATLNLEFGWNRKFHFGPYLDKEQSIREALAAHDHYQFLTMGVKPGMRGLDAGCGIGEPARDYVKWADVHITGVTITQFQVDRATQYAEEEGLSDKVDFVRADFCQMPFPDNTFDFVYAQEATVHAPELRDVYTEICRVLKPGGVFGVGEWCMTDKFDPKNEHHIDIRRRIERGNGIANMKTTAEALEEFKFAGYDIYHVEDHALKGLKERPWWSPLDANTKLFPTGKDWWTVYFLKPWVWRLARAFTWTAGKVGYQSKVDTDTLLEALNTQGQAVWGLRDGGKYEIFTPCYQMYGRKPENWVHPQPEKAKEAAIRVAAAAAAKTTTNGEAVVV